MKPTNSGSGLMKNSRPAKEHLVRGGGVPGEVTDLRRDTQRALAPVAAITVAEWTKPEEGETLSLELEPMVRAGARVILKEIVDGVVIEPPTGTLSATAYTPSAGDGEDLPDNSPDGEKSYAIYYEFVPTE